MTLIPPKVALPGTPEFQAHVAELAAAGGATTNVASGGVLGLPPNVNVLGVAVPTPVILVAAALVVLSIAALVIHRVRQ